MIFSFAGAAIVPRLALHDQSVSTFPHIGLGGRRVGALYVHYKGQPKPAVRVLLDVLAAIAADIGT